MTQRAFSAVRSGPERLVAAKRADHVRLADQKQEQPEDPRIVKAQETLAFMLAEYRNSNPQLNRATARHMETLIRDFRDTCKRRGIELPRLRLIYFVAMNHICVWPQELEQAELQKRIRMFVVHRQRHNLPVDGRDIAIGVRRAYPEYSPSRTSLILPTDFTPTQETMQ